ncbi:zinc finger, PHD-type containing protein [Tanacetum coccineum]
MLPKFSQIVNRLYAFIYETNHSKSGLGLPSIVALVMVIDKSWTLLERHEKAFYTGLTKFVDDCKPLVNSAGNIKCPCKSCRTVLWVSIKNLPKHITRYGWDPGYKTWVHHGEPDLPPLPPVIDNTRQPQMSDMIALLNDLSYIPPNNEQNEPIQEDIGETSNEPTQAKRNEFEELYASANEELYPVYRARLNSVAVILTTYNLPPWLCMKESSFMLTLLIPGPKSPGKDIDVYLRPLIDDLKVLWALKGVETIDVATGQKFNMRAMVLWTINDFPARSSLSGWSGQGYKACPTCNEDTPSAQLARLPTRVKGKHPSYGGVKIKRNVLVELNWTKRSIFYELEYWSFLTLKHNLDIMHIEKNVLEAILNTLLMNDKSKDTAKARQDLKGEVIRSGLWLGQTKNRKCSKPQAAYSFSPENRKKFCQFIKGVKLPDGFGSNFKHKVTDNDTNITGLKSHDCHIMMQHLLPYGLQQYLLMRLHNIFGYVIYLLSKICSPTLMEDDMLKAQSKVVDILCNLELIYPPAFFDIMIHLVIHLPLEALEGGPIRPRWMFPFERFMKKLKEEDPDVIHFDNSSDLPLSTSLNDLNNATLHIDGQSTEVDAPPDIIDLDEDDDIIDDEDALPHDLADSDDEDLVNVEDDDGVEVMSADVARGHGGDDRPPSHHIPTGCGGCFANRGKGTRKANLGGRKAGRLHTRQETRNLGLKKITDDKGPVPIRFEWDDKKTMMPLGGHASHWSNYLGELIREMPLYYPSWQKVPAERKAAIVTKIGTQFDLTPHMQSQRWADINAGIQQHLQKLYNTNKASLKAAHWVINPETGTYDVETIRQGRPESITPADWDAQIAFWNDPRNQARAAQNRQNRAKSTVVCRQGSRSLARLRDEMMASSETREYPSLIDTFFVTHTVNGVFIRDEDRAIYEMVRLQALGSNTPSGVPYTDEEINAMARKGKQRGHLPGVGRVLPGRARDVLIPPPPPPSQCTHNSAIRKS